MSIDREVANVNFLRIPKQPEESVFGKEAPLNLDSERATIAAGKARVRIEI